MKVGVGGRQLLAEAPAPVRSGESRDEATGGRAEAADAVPTVPEGVRPLHPPTVPEGSDRHRPGWGDGVRPHAQGADEDS